MFPKQLTNGRWVLSSPEKITPEEQEYQNRFTQRAAAKIESDTAVKISEQETLRQLQAREAVWANPEIQAGRESRFNAEANQVNQNYLAQLATQPKSWLEYARVSGQQSVIQPWMIPLMSPEYQKIGMGLYNQPQAEPTQGGWQTYGGTARPYAQPLGGGITAGNVEINKQTGGAQQWMSQEAPDVPRGLPVNLPSNPAQYPELTTPSAQYWGRMTQPMQEQYLAYEQERTGAPFSVTQQRLWNLAPPTGRNTGLKYRR